MIFRRLRMILSGQQCQVNGMLPDACCTPGAVFPGVGAYEICQPGYAKRVRKVSWLTRLAVYRSYGITDYRTVRLAYEIDHLVPLELGGSNDIANLWPQSAPEFRYKDELENTLHEDVCAGLVDLEVAQREIASDWIAAYQKYVSGVVK